MGEPLKHYRVIVSAHIFATSADDARSKVVNHVADGPSFIIEPLDVLEEPGDVSDGRR